MSSPMMTRHDARRIAESATMVRPDWIVSSLVTLLAEFRAKTPREVHLALLWIAYDPETKTPARLREEGPWWHIGRQHGAPQLRRWKDPNADVTPADPETIRAIRARKDRP